MKQIKYLSVADTAMMSWCEQKAIFSHLASQKGFEKVFTNIRKRKEGINYILTKKPIRDLFISRERIETADIFKFLDYCQVGIYPIIEKNDFFKGRIFENTEKFVFIEQKIKLSPKKQMVVKNKFENGFQKWKKEILNSKAKGVFIPKKLDMPPWYKNSNSKVIFSDGSKSNGIYLEKRFAKLYPRACGYFEWDKYIVIASPDGITKQFCYEFKGSKNRFLLNYQRRVAENQANLYSYFYERPKYRADLYSEKEQHRENILKNTSSESALEQLNKIDQLLTQKIQPKPPARFKCKSCEFSSKCQIRSS